MTTAFSLQKYLAITISQRYHLTPQRGKESNSWNIRN
uniref:Uncharacterized protein n=1 Tax=Siphoviridae sp. ctDmQ3 TaxID=2823570 RepID=A0A8S5L857_9CAUD|nr:MAG TPA: Protein of unknown function DUF2498 [Siphoviridae sp. ctDmQ3]